LIQNPDAQRRDPQPSTPKKNQTVSKNSCPSRRFLLAWAGKDVHRVPLMAGVGSADQPSLWLSRRIENDAELQGLRLDAMARLGFKTQIPEASDGGTFCRRRRIAAGRNGITTGRRSRKRPSALRDRTG
jgi:hypothetical protein